MKTCANKSEMFVNWATIVFKFNENYIYYKLKTLLINKDVMLYNLHIAQSLVQNMEPRMVVSMIY